MRLLLIHNPVAGGQSNGENELLRSLEAAGHAVRYQSTDQKGWRDALADHVDAVVIAGGDGTVRKTATALADIADGPIPPLAIVPGGTANNIARSLGLPTDVGAIAAGLANARETRLWVGHARATWGKIRFVEAAGVGLFALMLRRQEATGEKDAEKQRKREGSHDPEDSMRTARQQLLEQIRRARPRPVTVEANGQDLSGHYFLAQAMNTVSIGPRLDLAPGADPSRGSFELVLAGHDERAGLVEYLERLMAGEDAALPVAWRQASHVVMGWQPRDGHVDDTPWPEHDEAKGAVELEMPTALRVLVPDQTSGSNRA